MYGAIFFRFLFDLRTKYKYMKLNFCGASCRIVLSALLFCVLLGKTESVFAQYGFPKRLRVASYNIRHGEGMDGKLDFRRISQSLERLRPDVIALQEVDSATTRTVGRYGLGEMADEMRYYATYGAAIDFQGGKYGVGILSRQRPLDVKRYALPGREEARTLLVTEFKDYVFACTHLSLTDEDRAASLPIIEKVASAYSKPFIIAGDWNDIPQSAFIKALSKKFQICTKTSVATFPADKPDSCLDYIAVYKRNGDVVRPGNADKNWASYRPYVNEAAVVRSAFVVADAVSSDHRPVFTEILLPTPVNKLLTTKPYLQLATPTSMNVMFQTNSVCHCWVEYGTDSLHTQRARTLLDGQEVCFDIENNIKLDNLKPATRYYYRVCCMELLKKGGYDAHFGSDTLRTKFYSFRTPSNKMEDFTCVIFNDLHDNAACYNHLRSLVKDVDYDFVIFNGDCLAEPNNRIHAIRLIHSLADPINGAEKPIIFLRGNHEIRNHYSAGMHSLIGYYNNKTYSSFTRGNTRFVLLDCGEDKPDSIPVYAGLNDFTQLRLDQLDFLKKELKSKEFKSAKNRVLISHIPVFGDPERYKPCSEIWGPVLKSAPFNIAVAAHTHSAKFYPQGIDGCKFPVLVGGGPSVKNGTVVVLTCKNGKLSMKVLSSNPKTRWTMDLK